MTSTLSPEVENLMSHIRFEVSDTVVGSEVSLTAFQPLQPILVQGVADVGDLSTFGVSSCHMSLTDFFSRGAQLTPSAENSIPTKASVLVKIGTDAMPPSFMSLNYGRDVWRFDVLATTRVILAFYEGRERLPAGLTEQAVRKLARDLCSVSQGSDYYHQDVEDVRHTVDLIRKAVLSVANLEEVPLLTQIFDSEEVFPDDCWPSYKDGRPTRIFAETIGHPDHPLYCQARADAFEWQCRRVLYGLIIKMLQTKAHWDAFAFFKERFAAWCAYWSSNQPQADSLPVPKSPLIFLELPDAPPSLGTSNP